MKKVEQKHVQPKKGILKVDLTSVKMDKKGRVIINDPIVAKKVKSIQKKHTSGTKGPADKLCIDTKLCLDTTCYNPKPNSVCGCVDIGCGCPPLPNPNKLCIPFFKKTKEKKRRSSAAKKS